MKRLIIGILLFHISICCIAQKEANNWYFGGYAALNFNSGGPQVLYNSQMLADEGCSSISDKNGNLLFYSNGFFIWNRNHQRMTDPATGFLSIIGDNDEGTQTGVIIPWTGRDSLYFVFSIGQLGGNLYYSVVNMNRNGGLGEVVQRKILLLAGVCEKLTAVTHCNKTDFWAITHKFNSDEYYAYLINQTGIVTTPVISPTGNPIVNTNGMEWEKSMGYLKNSPDGRMLAAAHYIYDYTEITDFNTATGAITNPRKLYSRPAGTIPTIQDGNYGVEFSPDSRFLYVSSYYYLPNDTSAIYQFDITQPTEAAIQASRSLITSNSWLNGCYALQLGPDRKIYVALHNEYLGVINYPNVQGTGCQFVRDAIHLDNGNGSHVSVFGLPNFIQSFFNDPLIALGNCQFSNISFSLQNTIGISSVLWDFGDPASGPNNTSTSFTPTHIFTQPGQYQVKTILYHINGCGADTIYKIVHAGIFQVFLGTDTTICQGDTLKLKMNIPNGGNVWSNGSTDTVLKVYQTGTYWVRVGLGDCTASDTISVTVRALPAFSLGNDQLICSGQSVNLSPNPTPANVTYLWNTGASTSTITTTIDGTYCLQVTENGFGCKYRDSVNIQFKTLPNYTLGPDISICEKDTAIFNATVAGATGYIWNTGASSPSIKAYQSGTYWADVLKDGCAFRDRVALTVKPLPVVNLGNDTTLCESNTLLLDAGNPGSQYLWQDNSSQQTLNVARPNIYNVRVTMNGCISKDTIIIKYDYKPIFTLGNDQPICDGQTISLQPKINNNAVTVNYLWSNGSTNTALPITGEGTYSLQLSNYCGAKTDDILVYKGVCKLYVPSAFTPNNDGLNDIFKAGYGENVTNFKMEIYNRWGQKIFTSNSINKGWDGRLNGIIQPHGAYVWLIHYTVAGDLKEYFLKGVVNLIQ